MSRFRMVIDYDAPDLPEAEFLSTLVWLHFKLVLRRYGIEPDDKATFHGVRQLGPPAPAPAQPPVASQPSLPGRFPEGDEPDPE